MDQTDREIIDEYFGRLKTADKPPRDADAEALIAARAADVPGALYYLTQAAVVSEHTLTAAQNRIQELEYELSRKSGGLFGSLFGSPAARPPAALPPPGGRTGLFAGHAAPPAQGQRPSFLQGAMQTAAGVAGGMLLGSFISQLLAPSPAEAAGNAGAAEDAMYEDEEI